MITQRKMSPAAWVCLLSLSFVWGGSFLSIHVALDELGFVTVVAHRVGWAALILWGIVLIRRLPVPRDPRVWIAFLGIGLLNNVIPFSMMAWGQQHISSGLTSILNAATAIFGVVVAAALFADERLTVQRVLGVSLGFAGVATAIGWEALATFDLRSLGQLAVLGGTLSYAFAGAFARRFLDGLRPEVSAAGMLSAAALIMIPAAWMIEGPITLDLQPRTLFAIAYYSVFSTAIAYLLYYHLLKLAGVGNLMLVTLLIPPIAIVLGAVVLDETLQPSAFVGFGMLAAGLLILNMRRPLSKTAAPR